MIYTIYHKYILNILYIDHSLSKPALLNSSSRRSWSPLRHSLITSSGTLKLPSAFGVIKRSMRFFAADLETSETTSSGSKRVANPRLGFSGLACESRSVGATDAKEIRRDTGGVTRSGAGAIVMYGSVASANETEGFVQCLEKQIIDHSSV